MHLYITIYITWPIPTLSNSMMKLKIISQIQNLLGAGLSSVGQLAWVQLEFEFHESRLW